MEARNSRGWNYAGKLTPRRNDIAPNAIWHEIRGELLHHVVHARLGGAVRIARRRDPVIRADAARRNDLAALLAAALALVRGVQKRQERDDGVEDARDVGRERLVELVAVPWGQVLLERRDVRIFPEVG